MAFLDPAPPSFFDQFDGLGPYIPGIGGNALIAALVALAEEASCESVEFDDGHQWEYCWEDGHPNPGWKASNVTTGLRRSHTAKARSWRNCQYYLGGLPSICKWWKKGAAGDGEGEATEDSFFCSFVEDNTSDNPLDPLPPNPTGFNFSQCDFLGRRHWCSHYEELVPPDPDEWICAAPNPYLTGLGKKSLGGEAAIFRPVLRKDIRGYNDKEDGTGTGQCDCYGMGRGQKGCEIFTASDPEQEKKLIAEPIICNYYKPWTMGFGLRVPSEKLKGDVEEDGVTITEQGWKRAQAWEDSKSYRLPLNYELYNNRAKFQKCMWWEAETSTNFTVYEDQGFIYLGNNIIGGEGGALFDSGGKVANCKSTNSEAENFNTRTYEDAINEGNDAPTLVSGGLQYVWAKGGGHVCNGCRPECPSYSGKWIYLTGDRMLPGMPVTANQILELRFWAQEWDTQEDYDDYFSNEPNFDDPRDPAIYTFTKWKKQVDGNYSENKMLGNKLTLCMPVPIHQKEFSVDHIKVEEASYYSKEIGTSAPADGQMHFPSLVRKPAFPDMRPLNVMYPYYNDEVWDAELCTGLGEPGTVKRHNNMYGDAIKTVGQTLINKTVYAINAEVIYTDWLLRFFSGIYNVAGKKIQDKNAESIKLEIYNILRETVARGLKEHPDYIKRAASDGIFGYFLVDSVKLEYNISNRILICVDFGDGTWEYRWRNVISRWYGGVVKQTSYEHKYEESEKGYTNTQPLSITPTATATATVKDIGYSARIYTGAETTPEAEVLSTASLKKSRGWHPITYYAYSVIEKTEEESYQFHWSPIGNSNKIWVEINKDEINYVYNWDIKSAELRILKTMSDDPPYNDEAVRDGVPDVVELEKILVNDDHIPPNACILTPKEDIRFKFLPSEWELYIDYKYEYMTNDAPDINDNVIAGAGLSEFTQHYSPYELGYSNGYIECTGISKSAIQLMAHFFDENGRIISSFATKLIVNIIKEGCRGVDIFYAYKAQGRRYALVPEHGFCIDISKDKVEKDPIMHAETPDCGDHEAFPWRKPGPMWFPYNACRGYDMYDEWTWCNNCQTGYQGPDNDGILRNAAGEIQLAGGRVIKRKDYRYCGPYEWGAYGYFRATWAPSCACGCKFEYSDASSATVVFAGRARRMGVVDKFQYEEFGWAMPPFGNEGREFLEKFLSHDYINHIYPGMPWQQDEWMPMMMDQSVFFSTFNAYDDNPEDIYLGVDEYYNNESFRYTHQLNMGLAGHINEAILPPELNRWRWGDVFEVHHEGNCSYPLPQYLIGFGYTTKAVFYLFKPLEIEVTDEETGETTDESLEVAWAWQEAWKEIERNTSSELPSEGNRESGSEVGEEPKTTEVGRLEFVKFSRPLYLFDHYKEEHRRIIEEGTYSIHFTAPEMSDGELKKYPTLSIEGQNKRAFKIFYDENSYDGTRVTWNDEGAAAKAQGASGEDNIYEKAMGLGWLHSDNVLFDSEAQSTTSGAEEVNGKVVISVSPTGEEIYGSFNRGIEADMTREMLYYLPKKEEVSHLDVEGQAFISDGDGEDIGVEYNPTQHPDKDKLQIPGALVWSSGGVVITNEFPLNDGGDIPGSTFLKLRIKGNWGYVDGLDITERPVKYALAMPGVSMTYDLNDPDEGLAEGEPKSQTASSTSPRLPSKDQPSAPYEIHMEFLAGPIEMLKRRVAYFYINLIGADDHWISIDEMSLTLAPSYIDIKYESIKVWERMYMVSTMDDVTGHEINLDSNKNYLRYQQDLDNSGQYFDFRYSFPNEEISAVDKTRSIACSIKYDLGDNEPVYSISYDTLHDIEAREQRELYEYAYQLDATSDEFTYSSIAPYKYRDFLDSIGVRFSVGDLKITSQKLPWERHALYKQFHQYDFWRPGGHYYSWGDTFHAERCMIFGGTSLVYDGYYGHVGHKGIGTPLGEDATKPVDAGNSYYSLRFYVQQAKADRAFILGGGDPIFPDNWSSPTPYNAGTLITSGRR